MKSLFVNGVLPAVLTLGAVLCLFQAYAVAGPDGAPDRAWLGGTLGFSMAFIFIRRFLEERDRRRAPVRQP